MHRTGQPPPKCKLHTSCRALPDTPCKACSSSTPHSSEAPPSACWLVEPCQSDESARPGAGSPEVLEVFTTRPDTLCGATYMVVAPEHPLLQQLTSPGQQEAVQAYVQAAATKSDLERTELAKSKTGVATGDAWPCLQPPTSSDLNLIWQAGNCSLQQRTLGSQH